MDESVSSNTKKQYRYKLDRLLEWLGKYGHGDLLVPTLNFPLPFKVFMDYMAFVLHKRDDEGRKVVPEENNSYQLVNGHRSAILYYYKQKGVKLKDNEALKLSSFMKGVKNTLATLKHTGRMRGQEGKGPLSVHGYKYLAMEGLQYSGPDKDLHACCHLFVVLAWNLMARSVTVGSILLDHIEWENDALTIAIYKSKCDQDGSKASKKHVYANPTCPEVCPILALGIYVFSQGFRPDLSRELLGLNSKDRFSKWLQNCLARKKDDFETLGISINGAVYNIAQWK